MRNVLNEWIRVAPQRSWVCPSCQRELSLDAASCPCGFLEVFRPTVARDACEVSVSPPIARLWWALLSGVAALWWLAP